jgi:hypothetical protein
MCLLVPRLGTAAAFKKELGVGRRRLGVTTEQITVNSIRSSGAVPDSTIVDFSVAPGDNGVPVAILNVKRAFSGVVSLPTVGATTTGTVSGVSQVSMGPASVAAGPPAAEPEEGTQWGWWIVCIVLAIAAIIGGVVLVEYFRRRIPPVEGGSATSKGTQPDLELNAELNVAYADGSSAQPGPPPPAPAAPASTLSRTSSGAGMPVAPALRQEVAEIFARFDYDRTGTLSEDQIMDYVTNTLRPGVTLEYVQGLWSVYDVNHDDQLDPTEFASMLKCLKSREVAASPAIVPDDVVDRFAARQAGGPGLRRVGRLSQIHPGPVAY